MTFLVLQFLTGLASASSLFLVAAGLSLIFGVTRVVNFAHGTLFLLGAFVCYQLTPPLGFWLAVPAAAAVVGVVGAVIEMTVLRRLYRAPELFQLLATFGLVLVLDDLMLMIWGPADLLGPRAPGLEGAVMVLGQPFPAYELFLIAVGPLVLGGLWLLLRRTRWGVLVRAATLDREMVAALGVDQRRLFTGVFVLGCLLAGLGGALQVPRQAIHHGLDLVVIVEAFVVVVVGGLGSIGGAFLAAVLIAEIGAFGILLFPKITLVVVFAVMAVVLTVRPHGLLGRPETAPPRGLEVEPAGRPLGPAWGLAAAAVVLALALAPLGLGPYGLGLLAEILIFALFAASLQFITGTGGIVSFGHAAFFGTGAYAAALLHKAAGWPMLAALAGAPLAGALAGLLFGWVCMRLSGVYLAMLTLAFAQILHAVAFQWVDVTGGDNGLLGIWPADWASEPGVFLWLTLALVTAGVLLLWQLGRAPFGMMLRAGRDSPLRAEAIGLWVGRQRWLAVAAAGWLAGLSGGLYGYLKGSVFPDVLSIPISVDALVMLLLGGVQSLAGPLVGAAVYKLLQTELVAATDYWRLVVGLIIVALVSAFPFGIVGMLRRRWRSEA